MATREMSFALYDSLLKTKADKGRILRDTVCPLLDSYGAEMDPVVGDDRRFMVVINHRNEQFLQKIIESTRRYLSGSGVMLNGDVC